MKGEDENAAEKRTRGRPASKATDKAKPKGKPAQVNLLKDLDAAAGMDGKADGDAQDTANANASIAIAMMDAEKVALLCWICMVAARKGPRHRECAACAKEWDNLMKDTKRKKQWEMFKEFKKGASDDCLRRLLFMWQKSKKSVASHNVNLFPWAEVLRSWKISKQLTSTKGGVFKTYNSFIRHYRENKGMSPQEAHELWDKRLKDRHWKKSTDSEDPVLTQI